MIAVKAYYDGNAFIPIEKKSFKKNQQALIVIEETSVPQKNAGELHLNMPILLL